MAKKTARRRAPLEQLHLLLDETDIRQNKKVLGVYRDHHAHHAIVYKISKTKLSFVEMKKGRLVTQSIPDKKFFDDRRFERIEYPLERAVENFLRHGGGISDSARRELLSVLKEAQHEGRVPLPLFSQTA
ncbi:MAG: hypothetical protein JWN94_4127 [Betaproteobacteria bacterium]|jgi:hypothetical protein|nr:hypothetical protein [Betaproteobacteria bacterium]